MIYWWFPNSGMVFTMGNPSSSHGWSGVTPLWDTPMTQETTTCRSADSPAQELEDCPRNSWYHGMISLTIVVWMYLKMRVKTATIVALLKGKMMTSQCMWGYKNLISWQSTQDIYLFSDLLIYLLIYSLICLFISFFLRLLKYLPFHLLPTQALNLWKIGQHVLAKWPINSQRPTTEHLDSASRSKSFTLTPMSKQEILPYPQTLP